MYAWYFKDNSLILKNISKILKADFISVRGWKLLYVGISENLRERIRSQHLRGNAYGSTLRKSLGSLLKEDLNLKPHKKKKGFWFKDDEAKISEWMMENCHVSWNLCDDAEVIEGEFLKCFGHMLYLNIKGNETQNRFSSTLKKKIEACRVEAQRSSQ